MVAWLLASPGRLYVVATVLPLAAFVVLLLCGAVRNLCRPYRDTTGLARTVYFFLGGHRPLRSGVYLATGAIALSAVLAVYSLVRFLDESKTLLPTELETRWAERAPWAEVGSHVGDKAVALELGYRIDHLTALLFAMVACVS